MSRPALQKSASFAEKNLRALAANVDKVTFSKLWIKKIRNVFRVFDLNNTGYVTKDGFKVLTERIITETGMKGQDADELRELFQGYAVNTFSENDDKIGFDEYVKMRFLILSDPGMRDEVKTFLEKMPNIIFRVIDTNRNGTISKVEWRIFFKSIDIPDQSVADAAFEAIDLNKDQVLSREEFVSGFYEFVTKQDSGRYDFLLGPLPEL